MVKLFQKQPFVFQQTSQSKVGKEKRWIYFIIVVVFKLEYIFKIN